MTCHSNHYQPMVSLLEHRDTVTGDGGSELESRDSTVEVYSRVCRNLAKHLVAYLGKINFEKRYRYSKFFGLSMDLTSAWVAGYRK